GPQRKGRRRPPPPAGGTAARPSRGRPATPTGRGRAALRRGPSDALEQAINIERRTSPEIASVHRKERIGRASAFIAQQAEKRPFGVELGGRTELDQHFPVDNVDAHAGP